MFKRLRDRVGERASHTPTAPTIQPSLGPLVPGTVTQVKLLSSGRVEESQGLLFVKNYPPQQVLIKVYKRDPPEQIEKRVERESQIWSKLQHPNILPFLGLCTTLGPTPALIAPYCASGPLDEFLPKNPHVNRLAMVYGIADGLDYLHRSNVIHGGLNPETILVLDNGQPALYDFGRSKAITHTGHTTHFPTMKLYLAPEILKSDEGDSNANLTTKQDIYAFSMVMVMVLTDKQPFYSLGPPSRAVEAISAPQGILQLQHHDYPAINDQLWALGERCWAPNTEARYTSSQIMKALQEIHNHDAKRRH